MNLTKKINKSFILILILGISTVLVYSLIAVFIFQKGLLFPKVQANPATCTVSDDVSITGNLSVTGSTPGSIVGFAESVCSADSATFFSCKNQWGAASCGATCGSVSCSSGTARAIWDGYTYHSSGTDGWRAYGYLVVCVK